MNLYDLIIIGGGPAGITAGIYAARKVLQVLLLTKDFVGQVGRTGEVDNWPGAPDILGMNLIKQFKQHLKKFEINIQEGVEAVKVDKSQEGFVVTTKSNEKFFAKSLIAATGRTPRYLNIPGEKEFIGRGVSFCSTCDGPFFKGKSVVVVGGGNSGFGAALDLSRYAKRVFIFEARDKFNADEILQDKAKKTKNIQLHLNKQAEKIEGKNQVQALIYKDTFTNKEFQVPADGVFVEIGSVPATDYLKDIVELNERGEVKVNSQTCATSVDGLFAAGDINDKPFKQIVTAAADGCRAALAAYDYLHDLYEN